MYLPYGVNEQGQLVYIDGTPRGRTALRCPYCATPLIARKGAQIAPHFAHDGKTCREVKRANESITLPIYDSFGLNLSGKVWEALRASTTRMITVDATCWRNSVSSNLSSPHTATNGIV